jgi:UDP-N-acetylmuramyl pentapeptide phosphotransferase/UDP-N-acetylglucosamine-1-phosphate transferase
MYFTNMFNFMDGIDGIAGTQAVVAGLSWGLIGTLVGEQLPQIIGYSVCGASLGFLRYNWFPARVFMGDVGSTFLGFVFGTLPLAGGLRLRMAAVGFLVVWPFVADSLFTIARRAVRGENILRPHKEHIYQRLIARGLDPRLVCLIYGGGSVAGALLALMII